MYTNPKSTSQETHYSTATNPSQLMLFGETSLFIMKTLRNAKIQSVGRMQGFLIIKATGTYNYHVTTKHSLHVHLVHLKWRANRMPCTCCQALGYGTRVVLKTAYSIPGLRRDVAMSYISLFSSRLLNYQQVKSRTVRTISVTG
jgi:hypothetical protein